MDVWDVSRAVDFLLTVPEVDAKRIGYMGFSLGGTTTVWGAALEPRIAVAVSICGWSPFRGQPSERVENLLASYNYPRLRPYVEADRPLPLDMDHVAALVAPRPFLNLNARDDRFVPNKAELAAAEAELARLYTLLGATDRFKVVYFDGDHSVSDVAASESCAWFDRWLRPNAIGSPNVKVESY